MDDAWTLSGKSVLVTGASSGIGLATGRVLAERGAKVILSGRDLPRLQSAREGLAHGAHAVEPYDLADLEGIAGWMRDLAARHGPLSGVVHSAGIAALQPARMSTVKTWERLIRVNVTAAAQLAAAFRPPDVATPPAAIVLVGSVMGLVGDRGISAYSASKGAVTALTRSLALELAPEGIRVNCVAPGHVATPMAKQSQRFMSPEQIDDLERRHPLGFGEPEDVAHAIAFLLLPCSRWITGTTLVIDGGYTAQ